MKTPFLTTEEAINGRRWRLVDASGKTVGRLASEIAHLIRGKDDPKFTRHVDGGSEVIVINASKVVFTGNKLEDKLYRHHTLYPGGLKETKAKRVLETKPEKVIREAVEGMLPGGILGHRLLKRLKVYPGAIHPHAAQKPEVYIPRYAK
jgi:large subunit ribosomal protein L13